MLLHGRQLHTNQHTIPHSFIHSISIAPLQVHHYSEVLPTLDTVLEFHAEAPRQLRVKGLPKWQPERDSNPWPFRWKVLNHHTYHSAPLLIMLNRLMGQMIIRCSILYPTWNPHCVSAFLHLVVLATSAQWLLQSHRQTYPDLMTSPAATSANKSTEVQKLFHNKRFWF